MHYSYTAIEEHGNAKVAGDIEAESAKAAAEVLRARKLFPVEIKAADTNKGHRIDTKNIFGHVKLVDKMLFIKNLAVMLRAGFPVSRAIKTLSEQTENSTLAKALQQISGSVESGMSLGDAMAQHPKIFSPLFVNVVRVGETTGSLEDGLLRLADQLKKDHELLRKTRGAMIYPSIVITAMVLVIIAMFTFVLPKLTELFSEFDAELPMLTQAIIATVEFMKSYGVILIGLIIAAIISFFFALKNKKVKAFADKMLLKIPILGKITSHTNLARFCRTLSSLMQAGVPVLEAIDVTGKTLTHTQYKERVLHAGKLVHSGSTLSVALKSGQDDLFPPLLLSMVTVGEESGKIEEVLLEVAEFYETEVDQIVTNLSSVLEPALMLIVGAGVGILALGLIMPIYSITQAI